VLWSLSVEEVFYILFPLACVLLRREGWVLLLLVALLIVGPFNRIAIAGQEPWDDYAYFSCADGLAYGCLAAWISTRVRFSRVRPSRNALRTLLGIGLAAVVLIAVFRKLTFALGLTKVGLNASVLELGVALMLMAFAGGVGNSALSWGTGWLRQIGQCSYEIYLAHMFAVMTLLRVFEWWFAPAPDSPVVYLVALAVMLGVSVLLGFIVARLFSEPVNAALRGATPLRFRLPGTTGAS
jgi:peptidoglycan/LPS O-acetylase OafA/YrhL